MVPVSQLVVVVDLLTQLTDLLWWFQKLSVMTSWNCCSVDLLLFLLLLVAAGPARVMMARCWRSLTSGSGGGSSGGGGGRMMMVRNVSGAVKANVVVDKVASERPGWDGGRCGKLAGVVEWAQCATNVDKIAAALALVLQICSSGWYA